MRRDPENNPFYHRRDLNGDGIPETMCNFFVRDTCNDMSAPIPNMRANDMICWLQSTLGHLEGWRQGSLQTAKVAAGRGEVVIVAWFNEKGHPGHVALMCDGEGNIAQAGRINFNKGSISKGFGELKVVFLIHA
jgi:hypothetical protein